MFSTLHVHMNLDKLADYFTVPQHVEYLYIGLKNAKLVISLRAAALKPYQVSLQTQ